MIPVYEAGEADELLYLIMRFVEGTDLRELIDRPRARSTPAARRRSSPRWRRRSAPRTAAAWSTAT